MLKNVSQLELVINGRSYRFLCDSESPLSDVKHFACSVIQYCQNVEDQLRVAEEQKKQQQPAPEPEKKEVES